MMSEYVIITSAVIVYCSMIGILSNKFDIDRRRKVHIQKFQESV